MAVVITAHDSLPEADARVVDEGLGNANRSAAPLHEVAPVCCFARAQHGEVIGGAVGRRWSHCCELQQLWVAPAHRRAGLGTRLVRAFESQAATHGCTHFFLETFSFQAPAFYLTLGYAVVYEHRVFPHGIVKYVMLKSAPYEAGAA
jgi:GNAT superfamily N-acetyltransferase